MSNADEVEEWLAANKDRPVKTVLFRQYIGPSREQHNSTSCTWHRCDDQGIPVCVCGHKAFVKGHMGEPVAFDRVPEYRCGLSRSNYGQAYSNRRSLRCPPTKPT